MTNKKQTILILLPVIVCLFACNMGFGQFRLSGEFRPRSEYRHGYKSLPGQDQKFAFFTDQRTRIQADYASKGYQLRISLQDIRTWGNQPQLVVADGLTSVHEAWGKALITDHFSVKLGRQEIVYDDHRIFGNVNWAQQARSHDAVLFRYADSSFTADIGLAFNQAHPKLTTTYYSVPGNYKTLQYVWMHRDISSFGISVLFLNLGWQVDSTMNSGEIQWKTRWNQTLGTHLSYSLNQWQAKGKYYYQYGEQIAWEKVGISALLTGIELTYKFPSSLRITAGTEYQSGNSQIDTTGTKERAFTPFFGTNHKFNGHMDYFYVGNHIGSVGLQDHFMKLNYAPGPFMISADVHLFSSAADVLDTEHFTTTGEVRSMDRMLGTEIDLAGGFYLSDGVMLKAGYSHLFGTSTLAELKGGDHQQVSNWAWLMIIMKPTFFESQ